MMKTNTRIGDCIICNPTVKLEKGKECPVIDIDKITVGRKYVENKETVIYSGQGGAKFENGDTLMARITPCLENGKMAQARIVGKGIGSTELFVFRGKEGVTDNEYVYYFLKQQYIRNLAANSMTGASGRQRADLKFIKNIKLNLPSLDVQQRVASILSAYDNLIENNNKRIRLLEQMAENLYKEWFVRFRFPGHEKAEFENGLPKGWIIDRYSNVVNISAGGDKPKVYSEVPTLKCNVPIYSNGIDKDGLYGYTDKAKINKPCITISARGTVGFVCLRRKPFVPIVRLLAVVPKNGISEYYLYFSSKYNDLEGNGTSQQQLTVPMLNKRKIMIPENRILLMFHEKMKLLFNQIDLLRNQSSILSRQRDLLLPRLMSGKLEVKV